MQRALVTGGAGFIGSHVVDGLKKRYGVHVIDNLSTGDRSHIPKGVFFHKEDVRKQQHILTLVKKIKPDVILHIAGQASNISSFADPHFDIDVNFKGTVNVVMAALAAKTKRFLYASSMTVYGHPETLPISETLPCRPVSYYGISKYAAERFVHATSERTDLPHAFQATSFRMFNVYGPRQSLANPYQGPVGIFLGHVLRNEPITIFGDGKQTRDFIFIKDIVTAWTTSIDNASSFQQVFNIGRGQHITIRDLAYAVIEAVGKNPLAYPIIYKPKLPGEQRHMQASIKKAETMLRFQPKVAFAEGLTQTAQWATQSI